MKMNNNELIRVLLIGGNEAMREQMSQMLSSQEGIILVGEAPGGGGEALAVAKKLCPDVVIMLTDDRMSGMNVIDTTRAITEARLAAKVIIVTENLFRHLATAIKAGAAGLLSRNITQDELLSAIHKIHLWSLAPSPRGNTPARGQGTTP